MYLVSLSKAGQAALRKTQGAKGYFKRNRGGVIGIGTEPMEVDETAPGIDINKIKRDMIILDDGTKLPWFNVEQIYSEDKPKRGRPPKDTPSEEVSSE